MNNFRLANSTAIFSLAHETLNTELNKFIREGKTFEASLIIPAAVMASFTIEVGLKAILFKVNNTLNKGHHIKKLFDKIEQHRKTRIINYVNKMKNIDDAKFNQLLEDNSNTFVDWRYFFENSGQGVMQMDYEFIFYLKEAIMKEIYIEPNETGLQLY